MRTAEVCQIVPQHMVFRLHFLHYVFTSIQTKFVPIALNAQKSFRQEHPRPGLTLILLVASQLERMIHPACIINNELQSLREMIHPIGGLKNSLNMITSPW